MTNESQFIPVAFGTDPLGAALEQAEKERAAAFKQPEDKTSHIVIREQTVDNPGRGNCAFYAFGMYYFCIRPAK